MNPTERHELLERYLTALTKSVDPKALFLSKETMAQYNIGVVRIGGIGMRLVEQDGYLVVQEVIPGGTAEADDEIEAGDRLIGVADDSVKHHQRGQASLISSGMLIHRAQCRSSLLLLMFHSGLEHSFEFFQSFISCFQSGIQIKRVGRR